MSENCKFEINSAAYLQALQGGIQRAVVAVTEQAAHDANMYVKFDSGDLHNSMRIEYEGGYSMPLVGSMFAGYFPASANGSVGVISWNTPYAKRQYFTGTPIDHKRGEAEPHLMWADYAESLYKRDWDKMFVKSFALGLRAGTRFNV